MASLRSLIVRRTALTLWATASLTGCTALIDNELAGKSTQTGGPGGAGGVVDVGGSGGSGGGVETGGASGSGGAGMGGVGGTGGTGGEGGCISVMDCPPAPGPCETPVCLSGQCGTVPVTPGEPATEQMIGDCKVNLCDNQGNVMVLNTDDDIPADGNSCTEDLCTAGVPSNPALPLAAPCNDSGGTVCDGNGSCVACNSPADCVGLPPDNECRTRTCIMNSCGLSYVSQGTAVVIQTPGDCQEIQCDGAGQTVSVDDDADVPVDGEACTQDVCTQGVPSNPVEPVNTSCGGDLICDGSGVCVGCITAADCGTDTFCQQHSCQSGSCSVTNTAAGTTLPTTDQTSGDCKELQCGANGSIAQVADDEDLPADDGNQCTQEICTDGVPQSPPAPLDASCTQTNGSVCDGNGNCVACNSANQCDPGAVCEQPTCTSNSCGLVDTPNDTPAPGSAQTTGDCTIVLCDGTGGTKDAADSGDPFVDANECTDDTCNGTTPDNPPLPQGTSCLGGNGVCDGAGNCSMLSPNGDNCTSDGQCLSGYCRDGVCCDAVCGSVCEACSATKTGGMNGTCGPVATGQDPDGECGSGAACDGLGVCATCGYDWTETIANSSHQRARDVAVDSTGAVWVAGETEGNLSFGNVDGRDPFIVKYDASGTFVWGDVSGDGNAQEGFGIAVDPSDNAIMTGELEGAINFGGSNLNSAGEEDVFLVKFDSSGTHLWSKHFGDSDRDRARAVATDANGNIVVVGRFRSSLSFGGPTLNSDGDYDIFVAKLDPAGNHLWSQRFGDGSHQGATDVAIDGAGNVVVVGYMAGSADFGGGSITSAGSYDVFVAKLDASGNHQWSALFGDANYELPHSVAVMSGGDIVVTGEFRDNIDFGGGNITSPGGTDNIFLARLTASGGHVWSQSFGDANDDEGRAVAVDGNDNIILTGEFTGNLDFGLGPLTSTNASDDIYVARFAPDGTVLCNRRFGDGNDQFAYGAAAKPGGDFVIVGELEGSADFGGGAVSSAGGRDAVVVQLVP